MRKPVFGISDEGRHKNQVVQTNKMVRCLKFRIYEEEDYDAETKALICWLRLFSHIQNDPRSSFLPNAPAHRGGPGETERLLTYLLVLYISINESVN